MITPTAEYSQETALITNGDTIFTCSGNDTAADTYQFQIVPTAAPTAASTLNFYAAQTGATAYAHIGSQVALDTMGVGGTTVQFTGTYSSFKVTVAGLGAETLTLSLLEF